MNEFVFNGQFVSNCRTEFLSNMLLTLFNGNNNNNLTGVRVIPRLEPPSNSDFVTWDKRVSLCVKLWVGTLQALALKL